MTSLAVSVGIVWQPFLVTGNFLMRLSPYLVAGIVLAGALFILIRQVSWFSGRKNSAAACDKNRCSFGQDPDEKNCDEPELLMCSGCSLASRCQSVHFKQSSPRLNEQKGSEKNDL